MQDVEKRLMDLEVGLAHQQRLCEQLNEVVTEQNKQLLALQKLLPNLKSQLTELKQQVASKSAPPPDEKPPHY